MNLRNEEVVIFLGERCSTSASERVSNQHQGVPAYFYPQSGTHSNA